MAVSLWVDKYRPKDLTEYVWQDEQTKIIIKEWIREGSIDNILLVGPPGVGKTSLAEIIVSYLASDPDDVLKINASREGNIDTMRDKVKAFITTGGWSGMKYVILNEADGMSQAAQKSLNDDIEQYTENVRWILTTNSTSRIVPSIQDRCSIIEIGKPNVDDFRERMIHILLAEGVEMDEESIEAFDLIVEKHYPSLRGCTRALQKFSKTGKLVMPESSTKGAMDWMPTVMDLFRKKEIRQARDFLCSNIMREEIDSVYRWLYENIELFENKDEAIIIIADGLYKHSIVADQEINLSATMTRLANI